MPAKVNFERPPVRLCYLDDGKRVSPELSGCIEESDDSEETDRKFRKNYIKVLQGKSKKWFLVGVKVNQFGATLLFGNCKTYMMEFLHIRPTTEYTQRFEIEVDREDGTTEKSVLSVRKTPFKEPCFVQLTEFYLHGRTELIFSRGLDVVEESPHGWDYVYVTEYR